MLARMAAPFDRGMMDGSPHTRPLRAWLWLRRRLCHSLLGAGFFLLSPAFFIPIARAQESVIKAPRPAGSSADPNAALPKKLELERLVFQRDLLAASLNPLKTALSELDDLARGSARERDYETAIAARAERQLIEAELDRIAKELVVIEARREALEAALLPDRIPLPLDQARLAGVRFDPAKAMLTDWREPGASAEWTLPGIPAGGYEVVLTYQCNAVEGGTLVVTEKSFSLTAEMDTTLRGPEPKNLGTLKVTDGKGPFRLTARTIVKSNLMNLIAVELVPSNR